MMPVYTNSLIFKLKQLEAFGLTSSYQSDMRISYNGFMNAILLFLNLGIH